jgi:hypothetical protein
MNLTSEQVQAIREGAPVPVVPPEIGEECVLLRKDVYEKVKEATVDELPTGKAITGLVRATLDDDPFDDYRDCRQ